MPIFETFINSTNHDQRYRQIILKSGHLNGSKYNSILEFILQKDKDERMKDKDKDER